MNVNEKSIYGSTNKILLINETNTHQELDSYYLQTTASCYLIFCHKVENVMANKAIVVAINPATGILEPTSKPNTSPAPTNPNKLQSIALLTLFRLRLDHSMHL